jgi:hypothetical protein
MNEDAFHQTGFDPFYGTPVEYNFAQDETYLPNMNRGICETLNQPQHCPNASRGSPGTPLEHTPDSLREQNLVASGNDTESSQSFHTAAGERHVVETPPSAVNNINLPDRGDDVGIFHCPDCHIDLWDAFEHRYVDVTCERFIKG